MQLLLRRLLHAALLLAIPRAGSCWREDGAQLKRYSVDLSRPPGERWEQPLADFLGRAGTRPFVDFYDAVLSAMQQHNLGVLSFYEAHLADVEAAYQKYHPDSLGEMRALWEQLNRHATEDERAALSWPRVFLAQLHMQIENIGPKLGECTSIVAQLPTGVLHARNWDFGPEPDALGTASVSVDFHVAGRGKFTCLLALTHIAKWTTCLKPGAFSMSLNARGFGEGHERGRAPEDELRLLQAGRLPRTEVLRRVVLSDSYEQAIGAAATARPLTSMYVILASPSVEQGGGTVITLKGNSSSADVMAMSGPSQPDGWFLVQTNVDHAVPMSQEAYSSHRREHVRAAMLALGPHATPEQVLGVLKDASKYPADNEGPDDGRVFRNSTIASVLMAPGSSVASEESYRPYVWRTLSPRRSPTQTVLVA